MVIVSKESGLTEDRNGRSSGISHPSAANQEQVIRQAYATANLGFEQTGYFECHGTGTPVGDPLEITAIGDVFGDVRTPECPLLLGSVKTNLGHGEAASAISSMIKTVLCLENEQIPATIGITRLNPALDLRNGRLKVVQSLSPWPTTQSYLRASIVGRVPLHKSSRLKFKTEQFWLRRGQCSRDPRFDAIILGQPVSKDSNIFEAKSTGPLLPHSIFSS